MDYISFFESIKYIKPEIAVSITLVAIVVLDLIFSNKKIISAISVLGLLSAGYFLFELIGVTHSAFPESSVNKSIGFLSIDPFGTFFKFFVLASSLFIVLFSISSNEIKKNIKRSGEYFALIFGMIIGMMFMINSVNLILIYISLEIVSLSSYVLAGFTKLEKRNSEASLKYLIYGASSSGIMLFGISIIYGLTGTTNLLEINQVLTSIPVNPVTLSLCLILIFAGIGYKISSVPFHFWTPDVYEGAPVSITAFLSVASKAAGFALLIRFISSGFVVFIGEKGFWHLSQVFDWQTFIIIISIATMTLGNLTALWQTNLKRMLAYSSIAHAGYILLGLSVLSNQGLLAILIYIIVYGLMNVGAFYIIMLIANTSGSEDINDYSGLGLINPFLAFSLSVFLVSLTGLPPTAGFIGKLYLFIALLDAKMIFVAVIALLNTVVSLYYYARVLKHLYLKPQNDSTPIISFSKGNVVFILCLLIPVIIFGVYFSPLVNWSKMFLSILTM